MAYQYASDISMGFGLLDLQISDNLGQQYVTVSTVSDNAAAFGSGSVEFY